MIIDKLNIDIMIQSFRLQYARNFGEPCKDTTLYTSGIVRGWIGNPYISGFEDDNNSYPVEIDPILSSLEPYNIYICSKKDMENATDSLTNGKSYNIPLTRVL